MQRRSSQSEVSRHSFSSLTCNLSYKQKQFGSHAASTVLVPHMILYDISMRIKMLWRSLTAVDQPTLPSLHKYLTSLCHLGTADLGSLTYNTKARRHVPLSHWLLVLTPCYRTTGLLSRVTPSSTTNPDDDHRRSQSLPTHILAFQLACVSKQSSSLLHQLPDTTHRASPSLHALNLYGESLRLFPTTSELFHM